MKRIFIRNTVLQFLFLLLFWLVLSGHYDLFHISIGVLSAAGITLMHLKLRHYHYEADPEFREGHMDRSPRFWRLLLYIPWLIWQIVLASLQVARAVLKRDMPLDPAFVTFRTRLPSVGARVILANSITLTPGTITLDIGGETFTVHSLMDDSSGGILDDSMPEHVASLYQKNPKQMIYDVKVDKG